MNNYLYDTIMVIRAWKYKIRNGLLAKPQFDQWEANSRFSYNRANFFMRESSCSFEYTEYDLRNFVIPKQVNTMYPWVLKTPKDIRAQEVFDCRSNWKSAQTNLKNGHIKFFDIQYKTKKKQRHHYTLSIPGSAIKASQDRRSIKIYPESLNGFLPKSAINKNGFLLSSHKIQWNGVCFYFILVLDREKIHLERRSKKVAIDPGVRKLVATWDPQNRSYTFGKGMKFKIIDLLYKKSLYQSVGDKQNMRKIEIRIQNLVSEMHHQCREKLYFQN
jgi:transposase